MKKTFLYGVLSGIIVILILPELFIPYSMNGDENKLTLIKRFLGLSEDTFPSYVNKYIIEGRLEAIGFLIILGFLFVAIRFIYLKLKAQKKITY